MEVTRGNLPNGGKRPKMQNEEDHPSLHILVPGQGFPFLCSSSVLVQVGEWNLVVDTSLAYHRNTLVEALEKKGLTLDDIHCVVNTHLHLDHCGNNSLFGRARLLFHREEYHHLRLFLHKSRAEMEDLLRSFYPRLTSVQTRAMANLLMIHAEHWGFNFRPEILPRLELVEEERMLWPGVFLLRTPGHTAGHLSLLVQGERTICIAGDAWPAPSARFSEQDLWRAFTADAVAFEESCQRVERTSDFIVPGHEGSVQRRVLR